MASATDILTTQQQEQIVQAIRDAELGTSGEIRVHLEDRTKLDALVRAQEVFAKLEMHNTKDRTAVLIYAAVKDHKLAILGDEGIHAVVGNDFWEKEKDLLIEHFSKESYGEGLVKAIALVGEQLKKHFPVKPGDTNELPNEVSFN